MYCEVKFKHKHPRMAWRVTEGSQKLYYNPQKLTREEAVARWMEWLQSSNMVQRFETEVLSVEDVDFFAC